MKSIEKARKVAALALEKNAVDLVLLNLTELCTYTDIVAICHGRSTRQVQTIVSHVKEQMKKEGERCYGMEGETEGLWVLADFGDIILHVFHEPMRSYYDLEGVWPDAARIPFEE